ncbi:MAG: trigger factor [Clostridia bacterium]|nr:trigger factor [Clostridia bacterium]MDD4146402.1 trigger factor [Clostridia bacterium]MDD4665738.1 trigger factor [Clostridia bacterium]
MKVTAKELNKNKVELTIEVPEEKFEESLERAYKIVVKKINIPGFRKGKASRFILEKMYGREILMEEALQDAVPQAYQQALEEVKDQYTAVSDPEYEMVQMDKGEPFIFKASFEIKPEVKLGQYKELAVEKLSAEVKEEELDAEIEKMRQRHAKLIVVEDEAAGEGDLLTIDFVGKVAGEPFEGGTGENYPLELGSHTFIAGFEEQLIGVKTGETKDVVVTFPAEYQTESLAGQEAVFTVTVKEIKRKELVPLDDEFAKDVSEFATLQELRQDTANKLKEKAAKKAEYELRTTVVKKVAENAEVEIPESMIENRSNQMINDFAFRLSQQGIPFEKYLDVTKNNLEELKKTYRPEAEALVKADLVLEKIAKEENIQATAQEIEQEIKKAAEVYQQEPEKVREVLEKEGRIPSIEFGIMLDKTVDFIIEQAKVK